MKKTTLTKIALLSMMLGFSAQAVGPAAVETPLTKAKQALEFATAQHNQQNNVFTRKNLETAKKAWANLEGTKADPALPGTDPALPGTDPALPVKAPDAVDVVALKAELEASKKENADLIKKIEDYKKEVENYALYIKAIASPETADGLGLDLTVALNSVISGAFKTLFTKSKLQDLEKTMPGLQDALLRKVRTNAKKLDGPASMSFECLSVEDVRKVVSKLLKSSPLDEFAKTHNLSGVAKVNVEAYTVDIMNECSTVFTPDFTEIMKVASKPETVMVVNLQTASLTEAASKVYKAATGNVNKLQEMPTALNNILNTMVRKGKEEVQIMSKGPFAISVPSIRQHLEAAGSKKIGEIMLGYDHKASKSALKDALQNFVEAAIFHVISTQNAYGVEVMIKKLHPGLMQGGFMPGLMQGGFMPGLRNDELMKNDRFMNAPNNQQKLINNQVAPVIGQKRVQSASDAGSDDDDGKSSIDVEQFVDSEENPADRLKTDFVPEKFVPYSMMTAEAIEAEQAERSRLVDITIKKAATALERPLFSLELE